MRKCMRLFCCGVGVMNVDWCFSSAEWGDGRSERAIFFPPSELSDIQTNMTWKYFFMIFACFPFKRMKKKPSLSNSF